MVLTKPLYELVYRLVNCTDLFVTHSDHRATTGAGRKIVGLAPGNHGFHVHEFGDCTAADGSSAGGHFNPTNQPHAGPDADARHVGDMGNIEADASGAAKLDYLDHSMSLANDDRSIIGRSVVVHAKADDFKSQPAGDSGARVACGVIGRAKSQ